MSSVDMRDIKKYEEALKNHDWFYEMSEDPNTYEDGKFMYSKLRKASEYTKEHKELFERYKTKAIDKI